MINLKELLSWTYLTESPTRMFTDEKLVLFILISIFLISFAFFVESSKRITQDLLICKLLRAIGWSLLAIDMFGVLGFLGRIESLPFVGIRLFLLVYFIALLFAISLFVVYMLLKYKKDKQAYENAEVKKKYLPKKKK